MKRTFLSFFLIICSAVPLQGAYNQRLYTLMHAAAAHGPLQAPQMRYFVIAARSALSCPCPHAVHIPTKHFTLRSLRPDDASNLYECTSDPKVAQYTGMFKHHKNKSETEDYVDQQLADSNKGKIIPLVPVNTETGRAMGYARYLNIDHVNKHAELGLALAHSYWNRGLGTQIIKALINHGFENLDLIRLQATCDPKNGASKRMLEKCGMRQEGVLEGYNVVNGVAHNRCMYAIVKKAGYGWWPGL
jgi:ribosomal-protein-alanine N-acetyltransferase